MKKILSFLVLTLLAYSGYACTANFTFSVSGATATFTNSSAFVTGKVSTTSWNFGDGNTSVSYSPSHAYATSGTYSVKLVVTWIDSMTKAVHCKDSITKSVTVTVPPPANIISGTIIQDSMKAISAPQYKVWLIVHNATAGTLTAVDSVTVTGGTPGVNTSYSFSGAAAGSYRVKAKLLNGPTSGFGAVPTYHVSNLMWSGASSITHSGGTTSNKDIVLLYGTVSSGPGFIGGSIAAGANKGTATGIPNITVLLLNSAGNAVASATTDATGNYTFSNIPVGSYKVYPEDAGYATTQANVVITSGSATQNGINFVRSITNKTFTPTAVGIANVDNTKTFTLYPNPATDKVNIEWNGKANVSASVLITDVTGKTVSNTSLITSGNGPNVVSLQQLQKGIYFVTLESEGVKQTQKLVIE